MKNSITSSICCDIILPITDYKNCVKLLEKAAESSQWLRHTFIVMLDGLSEEDEKSLQNWYYDIRVKKPMPEVVISQVRSDLRGNKTAIYNSAILIGDNPYVYFQSEKDSLPVNIDKTINFLYKKKDVDICVAKCETFLEDKTPIETFPVTDINNNFLYDCQEATLLFPSYLHPLSSVMRKSLFKKIPYWDPAKQFSEYAYYYFILRCIYSKNVNIKYMPYTIKISIRGKENAIVMGPLTRQKLVNDIKMWTVELPDDEYKDFQLDILHMLETGAITTFKEIDARVEDHLEYSKKR
jgi:hypothetical protein